MLQQINLTERATHFTANHGHWTLTINIYVRVPVYS